MMRGMKPNLALGGLFLFLSLPSALAQETTADAYFLSDPSRDITRLNYYPHPGKFYFAPDAQYTGADLSIPTKGTTPEASSSTHAWQMDLDLIYGLPIEGLRIFAAETYLFHRWSNSTSVKSGFVTESNSSGFSDPTFQLQYRYFETAPLGFSGDISLQISPSWVTDDAATSLSSGSDGKGYGDLALVATEYKLFPVLDLGLQETLAKDFSGNVVNVETPASSYHRDSLLNFTMTAIARIHMTEDLYAQAEAAFDFPYSFNQTNAQATPAVSNIQYPFHLNPSLLAGYRILDNFCMDVLYTYQNYTRTTAPTAPPNTDTFVMENVFEIRARVEI